jgi:hypothetical protein
MTGDLDAEFEAAQSALTETQAAQLIAAGVPPLIVKLRTIGAARIALNLPGTIYEPLEIGERAFIVAVRVDHPDTPESAEAEFVPDYGDLVDLVAVHPSDPAEWATRRDAATWLGAIPPQLCEPEPVRIFRSPLSWLRSGRCGLCVLTRKWQEAQAVLLRCRQIEAEDREHARELCQLLERRHSIPCIRVAQTKRSAA